MIDLLIRNGTLVDGRGSARGSLAIAAGRIAAVLGDGADLPQAARTIAADGLLVLPGIVDPHVHFYGEGIGGFSRLAAQGGVTTFIGMMRGPAETPLMEVADAHKADAAATAVVDHGFHVCIYDRPDTVAQIPALAAAGFRSFKMFLAYKSRGMMASPAFLFDAMQAIAAVGGVALVHCEDGETVDRLEAQAVAAGRRAPAAYAPTRPPEAEAAAIDMVALASQTTGCPAYIVHVSSAAGLAAVARARRRGVRLWAETCPQYVLLDDAAVLRHGAVAKIAPPLRTPADRTALATAIATGEIDTIGSDHASYRREAKEAAGDDIFAAPFGMPGAPILLPSMITWATEAGVPLPVLVRAMAETPAAIFGLARKGALAPGMDADLVLIDPAARRTVDAALWPGVSPSPLVGQNLSGWPTLTLSRGREAWSNGAVTAPAGHGAFVAQAPRVSPMRGSI